MTGSLSPSAGISIIPTHSCPFTSTVGIKRLNPGDSVVFTDADGNVFSYEVAEIETVGGYDIEKMEAGDWDLTLFTCTNKGKARAAVRCREIEE